MYPLRASLYSRIQIREISRSRRRTAEDQDRTRPRFIKTSVTEKLRPRSLPLSLEVPPSGQNQLYPSTEPSSKTRHPLPASSPHRGNYHSPRTSLAPFFTGRRYCTRDSHGKTRSRVRARRKTTMGGGGGGRAPQSINLLVPLWAGCSAW